jgi:hypothetical protein
MNPPTGMLNEADAAARLGNKPQTMAKWRQRNFGPAFFKHGAKVFYRIADLDSWSMSTRIVPDALAPRRTKPRRSHHKKKVA